MRDKHGLMMIDGDGLNQLRQVRRAHAIGVKPSQAARMYADDGDGMSGGSRGRRHGRPDVSISGGIATVRIAGPMFNTPDLFMSWFGQEQVVYSELAKVCDELTGNANVTGVQFEFDTPGGQAEGFDEAFDAMCRLTAAKHAVARIGWGTSGGQWLAFAVAKENTAAYPDAKLGSIGCIMTLEDSSEMYKQIGIRPVVIASGKNKAFLGTEGLPVTPEHEQNAMGLIVAPMMEQFKAAAVKHRGLAADAEVFDGRVLTASQAVAAGLVGAVVPTGDMERWAAERLAALMQTTPPKSPPKDEPPVTTPNPTNPPAPPTSATMTAEQTAAAAAAAALAAKPGAATLAQLAAAFPGEEAFCFKQATAAATMEAAHAAYGQMQKARADAAEAKLAAQPAAPAAPVIQGNPRLAVGQPGANGAVTDTGKAADYAARLEALKPTVGVLAAHKQAQAEMPTAYAAFAAAQRGGK